MSWESLHRLGPDTIAVVAPGQEARIIHREDADPEHRLPAYRAAAILFGNLPQEPVPTDRTGLRVGTREDEAFAQAVAKEVWDRTRDQFAVRCAESAVRKALKVR